MGLFHAIKHAFHKIGHGISHAWHEITHHPTLGLLGLSLIPGLGTAVGLGSSTILGGLTSSAESALGLGGASLAAMGSMPDTALGAMAVSGGKSLLSSLGGLSGIAKLANVGYDLYAMTSSSHMPSMPSIDFQKMPKLELNIQKPQTINAPDIGAPMKNSVAYGMRYGYTQPKFQLPQVQTKMSQSRPPGYGKEGIWDVFATPRGREFKLAGTSMGNQYTPFGYGAMIDFQSNPKTGMRTQTLYGFKNLKTGKEYKLPVRVMLSENGIPTVLGGTQVLPPTVLWRMAGINPKIVKEVSPADRGLMRVAEGIREGEQGNIIQGKKFDNGIMPTSSSVKPSQTQATQATNIFDRFAQMGKRLPGWTGISGQAMSAMGRVANGASVAFPSMNQKQSTGHSLIGGMVNAMQDMITNAGLSWHIMSDKSGVFPAVRQQSGVKNITDMVKDVVSNVKSSVKPIADAAKQQKAVYDFMAKPPIEKYASLISAGASPERAFMSLSDSEQEDLFNQVFNKSKGKSVLSAAAQKRNMSVDALTAAIWTQRYYKQLRPTLGGR